MSVQDGAFDEWYNVTAADVAAQKDTRTFPGMPKRLPEALYVATTSGGTFSPIDAFGGSAVFLLAGNTMQLMDIQPYAFASSGTAPSGSFQIVCLWRLTSADFGNRNP